MLYCLGGQELTLRGWLPPLSAGESEPTDSIAECRAQSPWVSCWSILDLIRPVQADWAGNADYLDFVINPFSDLVLPDRGQWVTFTGAFDHPDAESCGDEAAVLICRFSFVLTRIQPG